MADDQSLNLKMRHSLYSTNAPKHEMQKENYCKSDANLTKLKENIDIAYANGNLNETISSLRRGEYYRKYEHDELPVKDSGFNDFKARGDKESLTNSELDKLEMKLFCNASQDLQKGSSSLSSLESNIKFFRTTVQEIFDNFYASMQDFELYKKRFHDILAKNNEDAIADMEDFIKDMIHHIMSSESSLSYNSRAAASQQLEQTILDVHDKQTHVSNITDNSSEESTSAVTNTSVAGENSLLETYKNDNYLTDSTLDDNATKAKRAARKEDIFNIFLLSGIPCVQIKMNDRNLLSEINIKELNTSETESNQVASAEDLKRLAAKKIQLERYSTELQNYNVPDREIPVKVSSAKKDIHMNEEFTHEREPDRSLMSRICSFLCRKLRKTQFS